MKKINTLFYGRFPYPQGMANTKRVNYFVKYFVEQKISTKVLIFRPDSGTYKKNIIHDTYNGVPYTIIGGKIKTSIFWPIWYIISYINLLLIVLKFKKPFSLNLIYVYDNLDFENLLLVIFAKLIGYKIIFDIVEDYSLPQENRSKKIKLRIKTIVAIEPLLPFLMDGLIVISMYLYKKYEQIIHDKDKIILIPISAEIKRLNRHNYNNSPFIFLYSGSYGSKDAIELLINSFSEFSQKYDNVKLLLLGKTKNISLLNKFKKFSKIEYLGYVEDDLFYDIIQKADVLCATRIGSDYANAGFPFKLGEYLATANPVICSDVSDVSYYLKDKEDALIVKPDNKKELMDAMEFLLNNPDRGKEIGKNGSLKCKKYFDPLVNSQKLISFIEKF